MPADGPLAPLRNAQSFQHASWWDRVLEKLGLSTPVYTPEGQLDWKASARKPLTDKMAGLAMGSITLPAGTRMYHGTQNVVRGLLRPRAEGVHSRWLGDQVHFARSPLLANDYARYANSGGHPNVIRAVLNQDAKLLDATKPLPAEEADLLLGLARNDFHPKTGQYRHVKWFLDRLKDPSLRPDEYTQELVDMHYRFPNLLGDSPFAGVQYVHPEYSDPRLLDRIAWSLYPGRASAQDISGKALMRAVLEK